MITIRPAAITDAEAIIEFQLMMALETENLTLNREVLSNGVAQLFKDNTKGKYYVAELSGSIIGCLMTTYEWSDWRCGDVLWIQSVYIVAEHRGKGVYKQLYEYIKNLVTAENSTYRGIRLYVDKTNKSAQQVYQKLGMNGEHYQVYEWMRN